MTGYDWISFTTDYGRFDGFVASCHGVIARIAPHARVLDVTHEVPAGDVRRGAVVLADTVGYLPPAVHLAVVDPGVGTKRRGLAVVTTGGVLVGPDNGLLLPAAERVGGIEAAHEITNRRYALEPVSPTFHGRDVFSPAAAHLALGIDPADLGAAVPPAELVRLEIPEAQVGERRIRATCLYVDRFGNIQLNLHADQIEPLGIVPGRRVEIELAVDRFYAQAARTFAEAGAGEIILYEDAYRNIAVAISRGNAAETFGVRAGMEVKLRLDAA